MTKLTHSYNEEDKNYEVNKLDNKQQLPNLKKEYYDNNNDNNSRTTIKSLKSCHKHPEKTTGLGIRDIVQG